MAHAPTALYSFLPLSSLVFVFGRSQPTAHTYGNIPHPVHLVLPVDACSLLLRPPTTDAHRMSQYSHSIIQITRYCGRTSTSFERCSRGQPLGSGVYCCACDESLLDMSAER
ncbi:hypothetical protein BDY19DRAFT_973227 [Irpex rosettiformis]|uniref:Uncharacterized protein n=1 Tax=Irpex rosettiformis TaxID=378272 RepID=A0ACB8TQE5_9APHY|nr:hypothetical protein BDY19DRAFT_973227 [Irpex rosettiformis]